MAESMSDVFMLTGSLLMVMIILLLIFKAIGTITIPSLNNLYISPNVKTIFMSIIISFIVLIPIIKKYGKKGMVAGLVLAIFMYIILTQTNNNNVYTLLPKTDYPPPTHLGLDGVSLQTRVAGNYVPPPKM